MAPRSYRMDRREAMAAKTRARILAAARKTLMSPDASRGFSIDAIASEAGVSRMTVYYQFQSKRGLLEALFDDLAAKGGVGRLPDSFQQPDPLDALAGFIRVFFGFWASGRLPIRRLHGMGVMDPDLEAALRTREEWRRHGLRVIVRRIQERHAAPRSIAANDAVDVLFTLTSFETFDALARGRSPRAVAGLVQRVALSVLGIGPEERG